MRVYEFSKQLKLTNKQVLDALNQGGYDVQSHMAALSPEAEQFLNKHFSKAKAPVVKKKAAPAAPKKVVSKPIDAQAVKKPKSKADVAKEKPSEVVTEPEGLELAPIMLSELALRIGKPANELILFLLKKGIPCTRNQVLSVELVKDIAQEYEIPTRQSVGQQYPSIEKKKDSTGSELRFPVIVIMGHVDHGKTTLLDFIRKTRVALKEKGGITQHLGAYNVSTPHGQLVFLDTPGHEAFTRIRARGANVADIAILIVAADDGVMPQTVEAIKHAQAVGIPIIVAINKIDKATATQIESTKRQLAQYDLLPEEWGGQTICVSISAKDGSGVDELLELVVLQSELMELKTDTTVPAKGFVLEAKLERGRGPTATLILHEGMLKLTDFFVAGQAFGRVNAIIDCNGKALKEVGPSIPVQVSGFGKLPEAGVLFSVVSQQEYKRARDSKGLISQIDKRQPIFAEGFNVILKADNKSSKEAIIGSFDKIARKAKRAINVIHATLGDITESDISLAYNTGALIYGFQVKTEAKAAILAKKDNVVPKHFGIIYQLLDDIQERLIQKKEVKTLVQIGTAEVRKVFSIKDVGVIAGCYVTDGILSRNGRIVALRKDKKIGEGPIKSLERDRKAVKEAHKGYECAFLVDGFDGWQVGDTAQCYIEKITQE